MAKINPGKFFREVRTEANKIVWPTWPETVRTAIMVFFMTLLLSIFFFGVDSGFNAIVGWLLSLT